MSTWAVDWDDTLVDADTQEWLPGALGKLRALVASGETVFIHSARANYDYGLDTIRRKLAEAGLRLQVEAKPWADHYVDDKALSAEAWRETPLPARPVRQPVRMPATMVATAGWWRQAH